MSLKVGLSLKETRDRKYCPLEKLKLKRDFFGLGLPDCSLTEEQMFPRKLTVKTVLFRLAVAFTIKKNTGSHGVTSLICTPISFMNSRRKSPMSPQDYSLL